MTPKQKEILRMTWRQVVPIGDAAAAMFYERLFAIDPTTEPMFATVDAAEQRKKLLAALAHVVGGLDDFGTIQPVLEDLGRRHAGYGVQDSQYDSVGRALLWTLEQGLGEAWTDEAAEAWATAYGAISGTMRDAARLAGAAPPLRLAV